MPSSKSSLDKRDVYYRKGKSDGYRARSAYKLLHLDEEFDLFRGVGTAVDLCAAPGSWTQVLSQRLRPESSKVVSVDLQPMAPLPGVSILQADITQPQTVPRVLDALGGRKADLVICDGAPDVTGVHDLDAYLHSQLLLAATTLALTLMAPHATLVFKIFLSPLDPTAAVLRSQLSTFFAGPEPGEIDGHPEIAEFDDSAMLNGHERSDSAASASTAVPGFDAFGRRGGVWVRKPRSSRQGSGEAFIICRNFDPASVPLPTEFTPESLSAMSNQTGGTLTLESLATLGSEPMSTPDPSWSKAKAFVGGGDLNGAICAPAPRPALSLDVLEGQRRQSLKSMDEGPSPVEGSFPSILTRSPSLLPPKSSDSSRRHRAVSDAFIPIPLPSPLPGTIDEGSVREFHDMAVSPDKMFSPSLFGSPNFGSPRPSSPLSAREREIMAATPQTGGAVSPALSSSSKTDSFFSSSPLASLPVPPKPLAGGLARASSIGRGAPPQPRNRTVTTPATPVEMLSTSPTASLLVAPTPLRSVTGPGMIVRQTTPPPMQPAETQLSPRAAKVFRRDPHHIIREVHHAEPAEDTLHEGDTLTPVPDDDSLPIRSSEEPGCWKLLKPLGKGAFASVWSAKSETDGQVSAVKMVDRVACVRNSRTASAFYREVEVLRHLVHQGIVGYVAHFSTESHHCLVLEQLQGGECFSLVEVDSNRDRMLRPSPTDPDGHGLVRRIFGELCRAVSWLHEVEVVHRDIKLENILFTVNPFTQAQTSTGSVDVESLPTPLVKLTDFGLSRFIRADAPLLSTRCGSEAYAAPEVVMGSLYDGRRTDAWALGVVLYALVAGELPFDEGAPRPAGRPRASSTASTTSATDPHRRTMHRIAKGEYGWREGVATPALQSIVGRLLTRDPQRRARVHQLWTEEWMNGYGRVPPPNEPMKASVAVIGRRESETPTLAVQHGLLVDPERIDEVARVEQ